MPGPTRRLRTDPARRAAYDVMRAVADRDAYANLLLPALLSERGLTGRDAAFATELTYGTLRGRGTYDAIVAACSDRDELDPPVRDVLRLGAHQLLATRVGHHAAVATSVDLVKDVCGPRPWASSTRSCAGWPPATWTPGSRSSPPDRSQDPSGYLAVRYSYPRWIVDAFRDALGPAGAAETEDALAAGNVRPEVVLALSPADPADPGAAIRLPEGEKTRWSPYGFRLAGGDPAPLVASGSRVQAAVQDEASQLAAALALTRIGPVQDAGPDRLWLDLCAGPGGKARLLAVSPPPAASAWSPRTSTRTGPGASGTPWAAAAADHGVIAADGRRVPWAPGTFNRVLADVPCSGLGSLRRRPEARWRKTPADVTELGVLQRQLLNTAIDSARPGGVVAYVTCSPHLAETRDVVTDVVRGPGRRHHPRRARRPAEVPGLRGPEDPRFAQFWPHRHGTDAIFLSLLRRC